MVFYLAAAVLVVAVAAALVRPILGNRQAVGGSDVEVFKAQLDEIDADRERGLLDEGSAAAARTEIARRILRSGDRSGPIRVSRGWQRVAIAVSIIAPLAAVAFYGVVGSPRYGDQPLAARLEPVTDMDLAQLLERAEERLEASPGDVQGWLAVAPIYQRLGRFDDASNAYAQLLELVGERAEFLSGKGENLTYAADGDVTDEARLLFERAAELDQEALAARIFLAIADRQRGDFMAAGERWRELIARSDGTEPWLQIANAEFARMSGRDPAAQGGTGVPPQADQALAGPTEADVDAAARLSPEQRAAMVEGMVQRLADRLEADGGSAEEWLQLVRSQRALGDLDAAEATRTRALENLEGSERERFDAAAAAMAVEPQGRTN